MQSSLLDLIRNGYTVVAASARLYSRLRHQYAAARLAAGEACWETPDIIYWQAWIKRCHAGRQLQGNGRLFIDEVQQRCLWQEIVNASAHSRDLLQIAPAVDQAMHAFDLCRAWRIPAFPDKVYLTPDVRAFRSWVDLYTKRLDQEGWIDSTGAVQALCDNPSRADTDRIAFYGFDEPTPQQYELIEALRQAGKQVELVLPEPRMTKVSLLRMVDPRDEIRTAALWARNIINREVDATIGIIVPNLGSVREQVETVFDQVLHPEHRVTAEAITTRHYSIALGKPLSGWPLVHTAMTILALGQDTLGVHDYANLLRSPFISGATTESATRARFELALRDSGETKWHLANLLRYAESHTGESARPHQFLDKLKVLAGALRDVPARQSPRQWAERFDGWLQAFGWPGERPLDSSEYQQFEAWRKALTDLASLGGIIRRSTYATAIGQLSQIVARTRFQPESAETPIQIAALPGAAAMQYDYLWITGMHDQAWPIPAQPNPFIPLPLQREAGLPGSSAEVVHRYTLALTDALAKSARELIVSYPALDGDRECRPGPLWLRHANVTEPGREPADDYAYIIYRSATLETLTDELAPPVGHQQSVGGSGIFKDQAACGFRAFARHRLHADGPAGVNIGLDAAVRGQLVHRTLHLVWQQLKSSSALHAMAESTLATIIRHAVASAIRHYQPRYPESFTARFTEIETARLQEMVQAWLTLERKRPSFTVQEAEYKASVTFEGLTVRLKPDRIDVLADGRLVILDYKTGQVSINHWEGDRPEDPQLPLYAVTRTDETGVAAIAFAGLKQGKYGFAGLGAQEDLLPGVESAGPLWDIKLQEWRTVLERLAREFLTGHAAVDPKNSQTCRYCDLHSLCRIHELRSIGMEEDDEE